MSDHDRDLDVILLEEPPSIAPMFARGVATGFRRPGAEGELPERRIMLTGVEQDVTRLAEFCEVTASVLADRVPATWLHVLTFPLQVRLMSGPDFPFPMMGMVHVSNRMVQHRPVRVEEKLTLTTWSDNLAPHRKGHTVDLRGEARVGEELVWEGTSTYLVRGRSELSETDQGGGSTGDDASGVRSQQPELEEEVLPELATWRLAKNLGRRYAGVSGDANPIHLTALSAKALGFPRAIAHGMWTHARTLAAVEPRLPAAFTVEVQFLKPILLPSTVVLRGDIAGRSGPAMNLAVTSRDRSRSHLMAQVSGH